MDIEFFKKSNKNDSINNNLLDIIKEEYKEAYLCSLKIKQFIEKSIILFK
ncbi:PRD domain-containing protein [Clostridium botulinum]|nr:PRD domain-containing protein [Clostridium botulinum]MCS4523160.1 PRD domain-containing protein [Clostridium botulinum]